MRWQSTFASDLVGLTPQIARIRCDGSRLDIRQQELPRSHGDEKAKNPYNGSAENTASIDERKNFSIAISETPMPDYAEEIEPNVSVIHVALR